MLRRQRDLVYSLSSPNDNRNKEKISLFLWIFAADNLEEKLKKKKKTAKVDFFFFFFFSNLVGGHSLRFNPDYFQPAMVSPEGTPGRRLFALLFWRDGHGVGLG